MSALGRRCGAAAVGLLLDRALGEPPNRLHPVVGFGAVMTPFERLTWRDNRVAGVGYTIAGTALGLSAGTIVRSTAVSVAVTAAGRELRRAARRVGERLDEGDLPAARRELPWLVGRDPSDLDDSGVAAAVIESVAENSVDAVVAPVFWALVAGAPGAAAYRAVNTMDAMVGHRSERYRRFGWAAARLDDVANWIPARLFALVVAIGTPGRGRTVVELVGRDARQHPSPNAGVAETAMAAVLGRRLGGPVRYGSTVDERPFLGDGQRPGGDDIGRAIAVADRSELMIAGLLLAVWAVDVLGGSR